MSAAIIKTEASQKRRNFISKFLIYFFLIVITACMLLPFLWMLSSSFKLNKDVFGFPIQWIPKNPRWQNYVDIWTQIPLLTFVKNTVKITVVVTLLQLFTSSFAAYAFAKMQFKGKNALFLGYIATIAVPWQAYMVPQFMMMSSWHLNNTHLAIMCLQAFSAFGVFLMIFLISILILIPFIFIYLYVGHQNFWLSLVWIVLYLIIVSWVQMYNNVFVINYAGLLSLVDKIIRK